MASKTTTTTKFEVEKFDEKSNVLLWKMQVTSLLMEEDIHKVLLGTEKKPSKMEDDKWNDIEFHAKTTIILCLSDEVFYNIMNKETIAGLWCDWRAFTWWRVCRTSSSWRSNYIAFRWRKVRLFYNISILLVEFLEVKLEEEDKSCLLLPSLTSSYDHLATTIMYGKVT